MKEQNWLSSFEDNWLKYHDVIAPNKSTTLSRIHNKVNKSLVTLSHVLDSEKLEQQYLDKLFPVLGITDILRKLTRHDPTKIPEEEDSKLAIAGELIKIGLGYYTSRFKGSKFFSKKINEITELVQALDEITRYERLEQKQSKLYSMRKRWRYVPDLKDFGGDNEWRAMCVICWNFSGGKTLKEAEEKIRHHLYCYYNKTDPDSCIKSYPPRSKSN